MATLEKYSNNNRVLQQRDSNEAMIFNDADLMINWGINKIDRTTVGNVTVSFNVSQDYIAHNFLYGDNSNKIKSVSSTMSFSKNMNITEDDNGAGNGINHQEIQSYIYFPNKSATTLTISQSSNGIQSFNLNILKPLPLLTGLIVNISQSPNWSFLDQIPSIIILQFQTSPGAWSNASSLTNSNLISLIISGYNTSAVDIMSIIPTSLIYLRITQMTNQIIDIANFFTGSRLGLSFSTFQSIRQATYSGGAIFPSIMNDHPDYEVDYIFRISNLLSGLNMTPDEVSRFLVDFANQVTACNLTNKRMRFQSHTPNTSYEDLSQPLFTTYASALAHITDTLGITVQFT